MGFLINREKADAHWLKWYDSRTPREKLHYLIGRQLMRWDEWILNKPDWISKREFVYLYGEKYARPICWVIGHYAICTNYRNIWHCAMCGKYPMPENRSEID